MRNLLSVLAIGAMLIGFGLRAGAEEGKKSKAQKAAGEIVRVDTTDAGSSLVIKVEAKNKKKGGDEAAPAEEPVAQEMSFAITAETVITVDGAEAAVDALVAGKMAKVEHQDGTALKIIVGQAADAPKKEKKAKAPKEDAGEPEGGEEAQEE